MSSNLYGDKDFANWFDIPPDIFPDFFDILFLKKGVFADNIPKAHDIVLTNRWCCNEPTGPSFKIMMSTLPLPVPVLINKDILYQLCD